MTEITREEALRFIRHRQAAIDAARNNELLKDIKRLWGITWCNPNDPEEKQVEDYIRNKTAEAQKDEQFRRGQELVV